MKMRIHHFNVAPGALQAMYSLQEYVHKSGLEHSLLDLIDLRASQINGCAYCVDMHTKDARARGESEQRLYAVSVWRDTPFFTDRERAALAWTEAVTEVSKDHVPDEVYELARKHFSEKELVDLTMAIVAINGWNRLNVAFRREAGSYQPAAQRPASSSAGKSGAAPA
ncbi:MAG TPA: carboxymuconolactone decarboxylase family protein [Terriglobia bacterium]|nr:carboxymuconolactone decarboxylase family protein [Terriglobia bacterium]